MSLLHSVFKLCDFTWSCHVFLLFCYVPSKHSILTLQKPGGIVALLDEAWYGCVIKYLFIVAFLQLYRTLIYPKTFNMSAFATVLQYVAKINT
jgi:hypothetical protein